MWKANWSLFILVFILITSVIGLSSNQPCFRSDNGSLYVESSTSRNISLITKGKGYINLNNENLLQIIGLGQEARQIIEEFRSSDVPELADTMKHVIPMIDGPKGLFSRVKTLEMQILNASAVASPTKGKSGTVFNAARLEVRLTNLEKKINNLVSLLSFSECLSNPCQNGGTCNDIYNGFQCNCPQNWQGRMCELDVDECARFVQTDLGCQNGAECKNTPGSYECECAPNWFGLHCTKRNNDCNVAESSGFCGHGVCVNQQSSIGYTCICDQGWMLGGGESPACTIDVDECKVNQHTCSINPPVECRNTRGSFTCGNCPTGYEGDGFICTDVNECFINNGGCSVNPKVQCINTRGSFKCELCPPGYIGDGFSCVYAPGGACAIDNGGCHPNAECNVYAETTVQCTCEQGYQGNGIGINGCIKNDKTTIELCLDNPCGSHGICISNSNNSFSCHCNTGYTGKTCDLYVGNPCFENPCHNGECIPEPEPGEFTCNCVKGYFGQLCESFLESCGGSFGDSNGTIQYPGSNTTYQSNMNCLWSIEVNSSRIINISFVWIDIEKSFTCSMDYVEIKNDDDDDEKVLGRFCGNTLPINNIIISDSYAIIIRFHSDGSKNYRGFQLKYTAIAPDCGGALNIDSHGTLSSPGSPGKYPPNRDCYWTLNAIPGKRIQLNFFSLRLERHVNCSYDYLEIRDGLTHRSPTLAKLCNTTTNGLPPPILTSGSHAYFHFHSDRTGQDYGFQMTYSVIEGVPGCGGIYSTPSGIITYPAHLASDGFNDVYSLNCEWHIRVPPNQKLQLNFMKRFGIYSRNCSTSSSESLEIYDGPNIKSPLIGRYWCPTLYVQPIMTNGNEVTLLFTSTSRHLSSVEGFTVKYETLCGGTFTDSNGIIESPFYPNPYPQNKICEYIIAQPVGKAIRLSFLDMEIEDLSYPNCFYDSLEIRDGDNENSTKIALLCGNFKKLPKLPYISTHNFMWLKFSTDHSNSNKGFRANYSTIDIECGGILKEPSGTIQSSKHPEKYLHNQKCKWIISVNESSQIQITWSTFSLENQLTCNNDYVEVYDNSIQGNASKIARYCGTKVPPVLTSLGNRLTIIFKTDNSVAQDGFLLNYISLNKAQVCGGSFFTPEGFIMSPKFPDVYPNRKNCIWTINVPVSNQIELNFSQFLVEESLECRYDFVEIRNGGYPTSPLIGKYCGSKIPPIISSMGNSLFIRFISDASFGDKGFFMNWYTIISKGCGGILNSGVGHIVSPNYPLPVLETLECYYKIIVTQGSQIQLTILDIELVTDNLPGLLCKDDFLEFYDGDSTASKLLGTFCLDTHLSTLIHSTSNKMYIKFRSSGFSRGRGFSLKYATDCNVTIKGYQGAIEMVKQENIIAEICVWTILAPVGSKVNITFTAFKINHSLIRRFTNLIDDMDIENRYGPPSRYRSLNWHLHRGLHPSFQIECDKTKLIITEGANINEINTVLWKNNCSMETQNVISSTMNIVRVKYDSDTTYNFKDRYNNFRIEWIVDGCGGVLNQLEGEFTSPEYPGYFALNTTCEWNIITDYGSTLEITIQYSWFKSSRNCSFGSLAIYSGYDDSGPELLRICNKDTSTITVTSGGNEVFVRYKSEKESGKRFNATYRTIKSKCGGRFTAPQGVFYTNDLKNYDSQSSCMWYIEIAKTHLINLTFVDFNTQSFPSGNKDNVLVYDGNIHGKLLLNHSGNSLPPPIISPSNKLLVSFEIGKRELQSKGFKAIYSTACGAKLITNDSGIITNIPYFINGVLENCTWTIISDNPQSKVTLTFTHIDIVNSLENINVKMANITAHNITDQPCSVDLFHSIFRILDGPDSDAPEISKFCKSSPLPPPIVSNGPAMRIEFTDKSGAYDSFSAMYSVRSIACGGTYNSIRGTISSPNYPNNYFRDSECVWILNSSVGNLVSLNFVAFELEEDEFCNEDYVEVREGDSIGPVLGIFCGQNLPSNITTGSSLWVKFRSNADGSAKGFTADFKYVTEIYKTQQSGKISSPMYPKIYRDSEEYSWSITVGQGKKVQIVIEDFISTSEIHELKIYDGSNIETLILLELSSTNYYMMFNNPITSTDNSVFIRLKAGNKMIGGIHFLLSWSQIDGPYFNELYPELEQNNFNSTNFDYYLSPSSNISVNITSPGYPHGYAPNLNLTWILHTEPQYHIYIEIDDIDFYPIRSSSNTYRGDYLNILTVDPDTGNTILLKKVYTNPNTINDSNIVGKNKVILTFISNKSLNGTGFKVKAKLRCGGQLRGPTGITSLSNTTSLFKLSHSYPLKCTWNVTVRPGRTILIKLKNLLLSSHDLCVNSYVLFKNGFYDDSPFIGKGKYCNESEESTLSTTGNKLQVNAVLVPGDIMKIVFEENSVNCGEQIYLNDGYNITQITSPSYPNIPPAHIECIWTVVAPSGKRISVTIEELHLEYFDRQKCEKEYLEFRDGAARFSRLINHNCQNPYDLNIETTDNFLYIKYFTDLNTPTNGFKLNVALAKCGGTRRADRGIISSPNYPGSYEPNSDCEYRIITNPDKRVALKLEMVNLNRRYPSIGTVEDVANNENNDDTLTIFDVDPLNQTRVKISTIFGFDLPLKPIISSGKELVIKFKSHIRNGPLYHMNSTQAKFLMTYETEYIDCDKSYDVESGEITSPVFTSFIGRMYCSYSIKVPEGRRITIEIIKGNSLAQPNCDGYFLPENRFKEKFIVYQVTNLFFLGFFCIDPVINPLSFNYMYESNSNKVELAYQISGGNQDGFRLKFSSDKPSRNVIFNLNRTFSIHNAWLYSTKKISNVLVCGGVIDARIKGKIELPITQSTKSYCQWDFTNTNGTIVISTNFKVNESKISCQDENYLLMFTNEDESVSLKKYCPLSNTNDKFTILSPIPLTKLLVLSNSRTINFTATLDYNFSSCGGVINGREITITSSNYPQNYGQDLKCAWYLKLPEGNNVNIRFNDIDLDSPCDNNYVILHDGPSPESPVLGKYCGNILPKNLVAISNEIWVIFSSESGKSNRTGFNLTLESTKNSCGSIFVMEKGEFSTTNYPHLYPNNEECEWTISGMPGTKVNLQFVERFSLEQSGVNCTKDYVQVFDFIDDNWTPLGNRLCDRKIPPQFNSSETKLKIRFRTDADTQSDGFKAKWSSFCGGVFTKNTGKIISPNYPKKYPKNMQCNYTISAPGGKIKLIFKSFYLEDYNCRYDSIKIYKNAEGVSVDQTKHLVGTYCGTNVPHTMTFMDSVNIIFETDDSGGTENGFEIQYEVESCGGEITSPGFIKSPEYLNEFSGNLVYPNNANCTWVIRAPPDQAVLLVFTKFNLETFDSPFFEIPEEKCPYDMVAVFDESDLNSNNSQGLNILCGNLDSNLPVIKSKTNTMYVQFVSDSFINGEGFVGEITFTYGESHGCGGTIRLNQSNNMTNFTLKAPEVSVKTNLVCGWLILAEPSYVVEMQVISYTETPKCPSNTTDCICNSVQFFDGPGSSASKIRQYCSGNVDYPPLLSSGHEAYILYSNIGSDVDVKFKIQITSVISICGPMSLIATNQSQVLTSPNYPLPYINNLICQWYLQNDDDNRLLSVRFTDLNLENTSDCLSNYLEISHNEIYTNEPINYRVCHKDQVFDFINSAKITTLTLHTADDQKTPKRFRLEYKSSTGCRTTYEKHNGRIHHPIASTNEECMIKINLGQPNLTISLYISSMIMFSKPFMYNYLKVYDGLNVSSALLLNISENAHHSDIIPPPVFSTGPSLTIAFRTTDLSFNVLDMSYTSTDQGKGCGGRLFNTYGKLTSPMYPMLYNTSSTCRWDIAVPRPHSVTIEFEVFNLGTSITCKTNYLEMYNVDQKTGVSSFVAKYCGRDKPARHISRTGAVFIRYVTTVQNTGTGWKLKYYHSDVKRFFFIQR